MIVHLEPDIEYITALGRIKQILARYRPDATSLKSGAVMSPRILSLMIERSEAQIPADVLRRLHPLADAVLSVSESGIAQMVGSPASNEMRSKINEDARVAYEALALLHAEVMRDH